MVKTNKLHVFNDPIYGFIGTPNELIFSLISHPYFQRLRRISQMGLSYLVYPGAHHTRFHHALGSMHLMTKAIQVLKLKNVEITEEEEKGLLCAILLHDIGHGPFSHALEGFVAKEISHEQISLRFMMELNKEFEGQLDIAISIFKGDYPKPFLNQLVSSQLDMDRLDYLKRDSFYSGVTEGNINSERLISMLNVVNGNLVVEEKAIYAVEKFLMARRFMYWQVYLHKTGLVAEQLLIRIMQRARLLLLRGEDLMGSRPLLFFLKNNRAQAFNKEVLETFSELDDIDVLGALKNWQFHDDFVLSKLCKMILDRRLLHVKIKKRPMTPEKMNEKLDWIIEKHDLSVEEASNFVFQGEISNKAYSKDEAIQILKKNGKISDVLKESDQLSLKALAKTVTKYYSCYPKKAV
ncbi:HD domain-containing protein [Flagellimonas halotolerans]|uniref:HD domain-containing protein n=1 Tax=Flagellimonas halotolerans TaxID=3112164 RepID=A0ABU6IN18_9FLAO|nr:MULTISPECIES: HD domain-containing protein [unclassified Allomuricauda]MEC3964633.1 HD domain-containing protein [Muricauda sp. SYSU M86414]MEC4264502.1 HD domain-containing protein [Muricauda sp. SYSU M84420]